MTQQELLEKIQAYRDAIEKIKATGAMSKEEANRNADNIKWLEDQIKEYEQQRYAVGIKEEYDALAKVAKREPLQDKRLAYLKSELDRPDVQAQLVKAGGQAQPGQATAAGTAAVTGGKGGEEDEPNPLQPLSKEQDEALKAYLKSAGYADWEFAGYKGYVQQLMTSGTPFEQAMREAGKDALAGKSLSTATPVPGANVLKADLLGWIEIGPDGKPIRRFYDEDKLSPEQIEALKAFAADPNRRAEQLQLDWEALKSSNLFRGLDILQTKEQFEKSYQLQNSQFLWQQEQDRISTGERQQYINLAWMNYGLAAKSQQDANELAKLDQNLKKLELDIGVSQFATQEERLNRQFKENLTETQRQFDLTQKALREGKWMDVATSWEQMANTNKKNLQDWLTGKEALSLEREKMISGYGPRDWLKKTMALEYGEPNPASVPWLELLGVDMESAEQIYQEGADEREALQSWQADKTAGEAAYATKAKVATQGQDAAAKGLLKLLGLIGSPPEGQTPEFPGMPEPYQPAPKPAAMGPSWINKTPVQLAGAETFLNRMSPDVQQRYLGLMEAKGQNVSGYDRIPGGGMPSEWTGILRGGLRTAPKVHR